jgi:predicted dehydrogenase
MISSWFVEDLLLHRPDAKVKHVLQAIGSSSVEKGRTFVEKYCPNTEPAVYGSYKEAYRDPNVDILYIGTPHGFHKQNCLDAIAAGKPIICEKAFTLNAADAREVFEAAKRKKVYVTEAMWLRHRPLVRDLRRLIHEERVIGDVYRAISEFGIEVDVANLPESSRYKRPELGAGSLLDIGVYALTWNIIGLDHSSPKASEKPTILAAQSHIGDVEVISSIVLQYPSTGRHGIVLSTTNGIGNPDLLARIHGSEGSIEVHGASPPFPTSFTIYPKFVKGTTITGARTNERGQGKTVTYTVPGRGYHFEADHAALDVLAGRLESEIMPWSETIHVMEIMDEMRRQGGTKFPTDSSEGN